MTSPVIKPSKATRRFSKRLIVVNITCAWLVLGFSLPFGQAQALITHVFSFVTVLIGIYTGIGHMDYRKAMETTERVAGRIKRGEL